jgi:hypothetical protein
MTELCQSDRKVVIATTGHATYRVSRLTQVPASAIELIDAALTTGRTGSVSGNGAKGVAGDFQSNCQGYAAQLEFTHDVV